MKIYTRNEAIKILIDNWFDIIKNDDSTLEGILHKGFTGFDDYTKEQLLQELREYLDTDKEIRVI